MPILTPYDIKDIVFCYNTTLVEKESILGRPVHIFCPTCLRDANSSPPWDLPMFTYEKHAAWLVDNHPQHKIVEIKTDKT